MLNYTWHFGLLACVIVLLAATQHVSPVQGVVAAFGLYGALHACTVAATLRTLVPRWRKAAFVASGSACSMACAAFCLQASRLGAPMPGIAKPALLLAVASGLGATSYAVLIRSCFGAALTPRAITSIMLACVGSTLAVLGSRMYLVGGGLWFAGAWWFAFSGGLMYFDPRRRPFAKAERPSADPLR